MLFRAVLFVAISASTSLFASDFPPDYVVKSDCKTIKHVTVCAVNRSEGQFPRVTVEYKKGVLDPATDDLLVFLKLNGKEGLFPMKSSWIYKNGKKDYAVSNGFVGAPKNVKKCADPDSVTGKNLHPDLPLCPDKKPTRGGNIRWYFEQPAQAELDVLFYARDSVGRANAWDVEVAFVNKQKKWDSQSNQNYAFRFE